MYCIAMGTTTKEKSKILSERDVEECYQLMGTLMRDNGQETNLKVKGLMKALRQKGSIREFGVEEL